MKKNNDPWDDSSLINAFDNALTEAMVKYKTFHDVSHQRKSNEEEKCNTTHEPKHASIEEMNRDNISHGTFLNSSDTAATNITSTKNQIGETPCVSESQTYSTDDNIAASKNKNYLGQSSSVSKVPKAFMSESERQLLYNKLLSQYHELGEQQNQIWYKLHTEGYWHYYHSGQGLTQVDPSVCPPNIEEKQEQLPDLDTPVYQAQEHNDPSHSGNYPYYDPSHLGYFHPQLHSDLANQGLSNYSPPHKCDPCSSSFPYLHYPYYHYCYAGPNCYPLAGNSQFDPVRASRSADDHVIKTAINVADKALSSLKSELSASLNGEDQNRERANAIGNPMTENNIQETDLSNLLNAWYSAGLYTGIYLQQSKSKNHP